MRGIDVTLHEPDAAVLERSEAGIGRSVARAVEAGKITAEEGDALKGRIATDTDFEALADADLVVEAVFEDPQVKGPVFERLDALLGDEAIIASNTSSIPIAQLASWTERPDRVLGLHFFSPVPVMKLVEIVVGLDTSAGTVSSAPRSSPRRSASSRSAPRTARGSS